MMRFSTRTRYGLRFLIRLASQPAGELVQLSELAREENISSGYLEQIVRALKPLGILRAMRGVGGGYTLACEPSKISLEDIFQRLEGELYPVSCLGEGVACEREKVCTTRAFWKALDDHVRIFLRGVTLDQLVLTMGEAPDGMPGGHQCGIIPKKCVSTS